MKITPRFGPHQGWLFGAPRRVGYIEVSPGLIDAPVLNNALQCFGLKLLNCEQQFHRHCFLLEVEGENLPAVPEGARPPVYMLEMTDTAPRFAMQRTAMGNNIPIVVLVRAAQRRFTLRSIDGRAVLEDTAGEPGPVSRDSRLYRQTTPVYWVSENDDPSRPPRP